MQPLDVSVFAPMKGHWRKALQEWKIECAAKDHCYATIPKKEFPYLMTRLLVEKKYWDATDKNIGKPIDQTKYREAIISGFRKTGLYPVDIQQPLTMLPNLEIDMDVATPIQIQMLKKLDTMRHNPPTNKHPGRPKRDEMLPAGESHTANPEQVGRHLFIFTSTLPMYLGTVPVPYSTGR